MGTPIDQLTIKIRADAKGVSDTLRNITDKLKAISQYSIGKNTKLSFELTADSQQSFDSITDFLDVCNNAGDGLSVVLKNIRKIVNSINKLDPTKVESLSNVVGKVAAKIGPVVSGSTKDTPPDVEDASDDMGKVAENTGEASRKAKSFQTAIKETTKHTSKLQSMFENIKRMFTRRLLYRLMNAIISGITTAFREGIKNAYNFAALIGDPFEKTMDRFATIGLYMKNTFGALATVVLNTLVPILEKGADIVANVVSEISKVFAILTGQDTYMKALKFPYSYAEALGSANGKAKELQKTIFKFDEINKFNGQNKSGSGTFSDDQLLEMFEVMQTPKTKGFGILTDSLKKMGETAKRFLEPVWKNILKPLGDWAMSDDGQESLKDFTTAIDDLSDTLSKVFAPVWEGFTSLIGGFSFGVIEEGSKVLTDMATAINELTKAFGDAPTSEEVDMSAAAWFDFGEKFAKAIISIQSSPFLTILTAIKDFLNILNGKATVTNLLANLYDRIVGIMNKAIDVANALGRIFGFDFKLQHLKTASELAEDFRQARVSSVSTYATGGNKGLMMEMAENLKTIAEKDTRVTISASDISNGIMKNKVIAGTR